MEDEYENEVASSRKAGCLVVGWIFFIAFVAVLGIFGYKVWTTYRVLVEGDVRELPQFRANLTTADGQNGTNDSASGERAAIESGEHPTLGADEGAVLTIVEFGDFECPFSKDSHAIVRRLMAEYGDSVRFIYRDYPIDVIHDNAFAASVAAECAAAQDRFWAYHDKLYLNSPVLGFQDLVRYATEIGLNQRDFEDCLITQSTKAKVEDDVQAAADAGVRGTPTFFFNGYRVEGSIPESDFKSLIEDFLFEGSE